ncbi:hypothetical protein BDZ97DRAFT_1760478 [Flammula alnicola]|nr:hypothetical protein BDZ97DRAFT_1760478 [Flammula alnicola]
MSTRSMVEQDLLLLPDAQSAAEFVRNLRGGTRRLLTMGLVIRSQSKTFSSSMSPSLSTAEDTLPDASSTAAPSAVTSTFITQSALSTSTVIPIHPSTFNRRNYHYRRSQLCHINIDHEPHSSISTSSHLPTAFRGPRSPTLLLSGSYLRSSPILRRPWLHRSGITLASRLGQQGRLCTALVPPRHLSPLPPLRMRAGGSTDVDRSAGANADAGTVLDGGAGSAFGPAEVAENAPVIAIVQELSSPQEGSTESEEARKVESTSPLAAQEGAAMVAWLSPWSWRRRRFVELQHVAEEAEVPKEDKSSSPASQAPLAASIASDALHNSMEDIAAKPIASTIDANRSGWVVLTDARSITKVLAAVVSNTKPAITAPALKQVNAAASNSSAVSVTRPTPSSVASSTKESNQLKGQGIPMPSMSAEMPMGPGGFSSAISLGYIGNAATATASRKIQRVCCLALCGIHLGPLRYLSSTTIPGPYLQVGGGAFVVSWDDWLTAFGLGSILNRLRRENSLSTIYSGLFTTVSRPLILRALYIDGDVYHSPDFLSKLLILLRCILNSGVSDSGLLARLSEATAGSLNGAGHSTAYEEIGRQVSFHAAHEQNDYEIPRSLRDIIADERVVHFFGRDISELRDVFWKWHPKTSILRDLKRKLRPIQWLPLTFLR